MILMIIVSIIGSLFFVDKNKMILLSKSSFKKDYHSLFIKRNLQFTFVRLFFFCCSILTISTWISLNIDNKQIKSFLINLYKKLLLINIDFEFMVCMVSLPILFSVTYIRFINLDLKIILSLLFLFFILFVKYFQVKRFIQKKHLSLFNIILYLCIIDLIPLITLYKILS